MEVFHNQQKCSTIKNGINELVQAQRSHRLLQSVTTARRLKSKTEVTFSYRFLDVGLKIASSCDGFD
jgi:hypothetical protein